MNVTAAGERATSTPGKRGTSPSRGQNGLPTNVRLHERVLSGAPADLAAYVHGLHPYIRGSLDWCRETSRYRYQNGVDGPEVMRPGELHSTPPDHTEDPIPIPAIAWWWRVAGKG